MTVPLTLLPAVGCSTEMPFDDDADFAAGVCASANKPANDASTSPMKEDLRKFMSAFVFRTGRHVQSHQYSSDPAVTPRAEVKSEVGRAVLNAADEGETERPYLKRDLLTALCQTRVRN